MKVISTWGLRGGVGTTSVVAMLAHALHDLGEKVLVIDLNPSDMLRLHFNVPYTDDHGWVAAGVRNAPWHQHTYAVEDGFWLLAYGRQGVQACDETSVFTVDSDQFWCRELAGLSRHFTWVLFDLPAAATGFPQLRSRSDLDIVVVGPDAGCHILLDSTQLSEATHIFVNKYDPAHQLSNDLLLDWRYRYSRALLPVLMHRDEAVNEALAMKTVATRQSRDSAAALDARTFAAWCIAQRGAQE